MFSDDDLPPNKTLGLYNMVIVVRAVFYEGNRYYWQIFLDTFLYESKTIQNCYIMIELTFLNVLILTRQVHQKSIIESVVTKEYHCIIYHNWYILDEVFKFQPDVYNGRHDVLMMSLTLSDIAILNIHGVYYNCIINGINKGETLNCKM